MNKYTIDFVKAAFIRAIRTIAQTAVSMITVGAAFDEVNWHSVISISLVAGIVSILTSIATGLPEATADGELVVDVNNPDEMMYTLSCNNDPASWAKQKTILLKVVEAKPKKEDTEE